MLPLRKYRPSPFGRFKDELVAFFHPAYPDHTPPLLTLPAIDSTAGGGRGIDYETALAACGIVACNRWDFGVYFAEKREITGEQQGRVWRRTGKPIDGVLRAGFNYYFVVGGPDYRYPVVASFDHWRFPHDALPPRWTMLSMSGPAPGSLVTNRSSPTYNHGPSCFEKTKLALVPPFSNKGWLESNQMERYYQLQGEDDRKGFRNNIRRFFGRCYLNSSFPRRLSRRFQLHPSLSLIAISKECRQSRSMLPRATNIRCEHLFARFAFIVLSEENYKFLTGPHEYVVCLFNVEKGEQYTVQLHSDAIAQQSRIFPAAASLKKISLVQHRALLNREARETRLDDDSDSGWEASSESSGETDHIPRGRTRRRSPAYYQCRALWEDIQQEQDHAQHTSPVQGAPTLQHSTSISSLSLSPRVSVTSLSTQQQESTSEMDFEYDTKPNPAAGQTGSKRPCEDEEDDTDTSQLCKRLRLI
ncbi:hypothetical protein F5Y10DRAFT_243533 [Nemania abortiva]|nr:hypothetical protein F5Y10DRAFT_243533 [Nemania abortiva]